MGECAFGMYRQSTCFELEHDQGLEKGWKTYSSSRCHFNSLHNTPSSSSKPYSPFRRTANVKYCWKSAVDTRLSSRLCHDMLADHIKLLYFRDVRCLSRGNMPSWEFAWTAWRIDSFLISENKENSWLASRPHFHAKSDSFSGYIRKSRAWIYLRKQERLQF